MGFEFLEFLDFLDFLDFNSLFCSCVSNWLVFWKLAANAKNLGLVDVCGHFEGVPAKGNVYVFDTKKCASDDENNDDEESDVIEQWKEVPISWLQENYSKPDFRTLLENV